MAGEASLDFTGADAVGAAGNHVVLAAGVPEVAIRILGCEIAGQQPVAGKLVARGGLVIPVAQEHARHRALERDLTDCAIRHRLALIVQQRYFVAGDRTAQ